VSSELTVDGTPLLLTAGDVVVIPGGVPHAGRSITACKIIDVWHPLRDDYRINN
jgi:quercetin dioxygenase-like cupin family protein